MSTSPQAVIAFGQRMRSLRLAVNALLLLGAVSLGGCGGKPTEEQCEQFADHFVKLLQESRERPDARVNKLASSKRQEIIDTCVKEGTAKEVECVLAAASLTDVETNCK